MKTFVIDNGSKYINDLLRALKEYEPILVNFSDLNHRQIGDEDLVILSGGHNSPVLWHDKEYADEIDIIKNHKGSIIGICLGFQLIAHVYGSHLHRLRDRQKGLIAIEPSCANSIVQSNQTFDVYENHNWSVEKLRKPLIALAHSSDGIEVMKHESRPIYGMQFHPEGREGNGGVALQNILNVIKSPKLIR